MGLFEATASRERSMKITKSWVVGAMSVAMALLVAGGPTRAQEKRAVFAPNDFHWQGNLKAGQTLEVVNTNGEIGANRASGDGARVDGVHGSGDDGELF